MRVKLMCVCLCSLLLVCTAAWTQETTGSIAGTVKDPSGAVVPKAKVTLTDADKNVVVRSSATGGAGEFSFPELPVGRYNVAVEAQGFQKYVQTGLVLNVNDRLTVSPALQVGSTTETVTVEAAAQQVNLQNATATGVVSGTQIRELSLANRNFLELVFTVPGTSNSGSSAFFPGATTPVGTALVTIQVNGGRREENNFQVDGADNVDRGSNLTLLSFPSVDSLAEFRVVRGVYDAESGRSAGAQINAITRSGTSSLHGSAYEFFRNNVLNANTFANKIKVGVTNKPPILRWNDFGGTFGGPVYIPGIYKQRNKTFFFFSEEARRIIVYTNPTGNVPLPGMIQGNFQHPVCTKWANTAAGAAGACQSFGTSIPSSQWDPVAAAYVKGLFSLFPTGPNAATPSNPFNYVGNLAGVFNFREEMLRVDHVFSSKLSLNGKYLHDTVPTVEPFGLFNGGYPIDKVATTTTNSPGKQYHISATWAPTPTFLVDGGYRYSYGAILNNATGAISRKISTDIDSALNSRLPFTNTVDRVAGIGLTGGTGIASPTSPYADYNINQTYHGNVTKVLGTHTLKFGGIYYHYNKHENQLSGSNNGSFSFDDTNRPTATTVAPGGGFVCTAATCPFSYEQSYANFLLGQDISFSQASLDVTANIFANQFEYFGQDTWRVKPNFTVTYGIRHSFFRQPTDASGPGGTSRLSNFDPALFDINKTPCITSAGGIDVKLVNGVVTTSACNPNYTPLNGFIYPNPPTFQGYVGTKSPFGSKVGKEYNRAIAPRIGIAWDPWKDGKTSLRAGYGIFYDSGIEFGEAELNTGLNPGFLTNLSITRSTFANPVGTTTTTCVAPNFAGCQAAPSINMRVPINYMSPYTQQWSLDIQRQVSNTMFVDIGYFGNNGIHLPGYVDPSAPPIGGYLKCTTASKCFAGPPNAANPAVNGVDLSTGCPTATPCVNSLGNTTKLNVLRQFVGYGAVRQMADIYTSNYHSLQADIQKHFSGQSLVRIAYTWSHGLTTATADRSTGASNLPQDLTDFKNAYGPTIADRRHILTGNFVWQLPWLRTQQGFTGHVLGGWQFSGVQTFQTGLPLTAQIGNGGCNAGTGANCLDVLGLGCFGATAFGCRVNQVGDPNAGAAHTLTNWINASAFQPASAGQLTVPTERPGAIRGPGFWNTDLSIFKNMKFTEAFSGQFRVEMFNAFNHTNPLCCVSLSFASSSFNTVNSARDPRNIQLALKLNF